MAKTKRRPPANSPRRNGILTEEEKVFVVRALAYGRTPQQIVDDLRKEFGSEIARQSVQFYDPTRGEKPPRRWCDLYDSYRKEFFEDVSAIPIAHEGVVLRTLEEIRVRNLARGADQLAMHAVVESVKIRNGLYSNQRLLELANRGADPFRLIVETTGGAD